MIAAIPNAHLAPAVSNSAIRRARVYFPPVSPIKLPKSTGLDPASLQPFNPLRIIASTKPSVEKPPFEVHDLARGLPGAPAAAGPTASATIPAGVLSPVPSQSRYGVSPDFAPPVAPMPIVNPSLGPSTDPVWASSAPQRSAMPSGAENAASDVVSWLGENKALAIGAVAVLGLGVFLLARHR